MAILMPNSAFLHVERTGGTWVREVLLTHVKGSKNLIHSHIGMKRLLQQHGDAKNIFCFTRNPLDWYKSYWRRREELGWTPRPFDSDCGGWKDNESHHVEFDYFIDRVISCKAHHGFFTKRLKFNMYYDNDKKITDVGKFENLTDDLINLLKKYGEEFDEDKIRNHPPANVSYFKKDETKYRQDQFNKMVELEGWAINEFGYSGSLTL